MIPAKTIELSGGVTATLTELDVRDGLAVLEALEASGGGLDELIFVETEQLIALLPDKIKIEAQPACLTYSDLDAVAVAFVEVNKSFLARTLKRQSRKAPDAQATL